MTDGGTEDVLVPTADRSELHFHRERIAGIPFCGPMAGNYERRTRDEAAEFAEPCSRCFADELRADGSGQITPPDSELLGEDRLPMTQGCTRVESALIRYWPDRGDGDVSLGLGYGYDAGTGRSGVHLGLDYETDDVETAVYGTLSPQQARELAVALEHFADAVEAER